MTSLKNLRVGVIGANWSLVGHLPAWRSLPGVEVVAICTAHEGSARKAAAEQGVAKPYWDYRAMVEDPEIDIIDVGTRPSFRYDMVMRSLATGKHVLNANPFAPDLARAREMRAAQRRAGTVGMVEAQFQWLPQFSRMKELIDEGYIGDVYGFNCRCQFPLIRDGDAIFPFVTRPGYTTNYSWLGDPEAGASALRNLGGHCLHALIYLFGDVESVSADLATHVREWRFDDGSRYTPRTVDTAMLTLRMRQGATGQLNASWAVADARGFELDVFGSQGRLRIESQSGFPDSTNTVLYAAPAAKRGMNGQLERVADIPERLSTIDGNPIITPPGARAVVPIARMFNAMVSAIREGGEAGPGFAQACHVQAVCEAAEESDRRGIRVAPASIDDGGSRQHD